jgi:amino acid adenylation domain-containing protein
MDKREELLERIKHLPADKQAKLFKQLDSGDAQKIVPVADSPNLAPASYSQEGLWNVYEIEGKNDKYNMPSAYQLRNTLRVDFLTKSIKYVVARHDSLRTSFVKRDGELYQTVDPAGSFEVSFVDLQGLSEKEQKDKTYSLIENVGGHVFDLETGPLFLVSLIRIAEDYHVLVICAHHIVFDGYSKGVLLKEIRDCYEQLCNGEGGSTQLSLPELPIQFSDFAHWEKRQDYLDEQVDFWANKLKDAPHLLSIGDKERANKQTSNGFSVPISLPVDLAAQLKSLGRKAGCSPYMTMLATFSIALSRYADQNEVLIGTPIENRRQQELSGLIGYFLNTTVMDIVVDEKLNFVDFLKTVKNTCTEAYSKQEAPFNLVVEAVNPVRSLTVSPLFQAMFVFQVAGASKFSLPGLEIAQIDNEKVDIRDLDKAYSDSGDGIQSGQFIEFKSHTKYDLYLTFIEESDGSLGGWLTYDRNLMSQDYIRNFLVNYVDFLESLVAHADQPLHAVPIANQGELPLLEQVNNNHTHVESVNTIAGEFQRQVAETPDAIALMYQDASMTFKLLNARANQLAHYLVSHGVQCGAVVGVAMPRCPQSIIATLAVLKVGAAYLPLDPKLPTSRLDQYIASAGAKMVIGLSSDANASPLSLTVDKFIRMDEINTQLAKLSEDNLSITLSPQLAAYVLFTSGSTGQSKGVIASHAATLNRLAWTWRVNPYSDNDVLCHKTTCSFVDAVAEVWSGLLQGVPLVIIADDQVIDLYEFVKTLEERRVTRLTLVPSLLLSMLDHYPELGESLPDLKFVVCSGEALREDLSRRFYDAFTGAQLLNLYGSTEVAADATHYLVPAESEPGSLIPIGRPLSNCKVYVLDHYLNRCPVGVPGELFIGGDCVAMSYYGDPRLTAEKFIPDQFSNIGGRLFSSNDQVRLRRDGELDYLGRKDNQIKLRGFRIHLDEIQNQLNQHASIKSSVAVLNTDPEIVGKEAGSEGVLIAYVIQEDLLDTPLDVDSVRMYLRETLPDYMVPKHIEFLPEFPLLENGKIDRQGLPAPDFSKLSRATHVEPKSETEKKVAEVWLRLLNVPQVGINDNFFDLGGHSVIATRVSNAIRELFNLDIQVRDVFNFLTVAELSQYIDSLALAQSLTDETNSENLDEEVFEF